jgi:hypothetical protein
MKEPIKNVNNPVSLFLQIIFTSYLVLISEQKYSIHHCHQWIYSLVEVHHYLIRSVENNGDANVYNPTSRYLNPI